jgi:hypothetical protein
VPANYRNTLKNREIESNIGVGSENRKENGAKMSVYSTKRRIVICVKGEGPQRINN